MRFLPLRLVPGDDLRATLEAQAQAAFPDGAFVVCGIGSYRFRCSAVVRLAAGSGAADSVQGILIHYVGGPAPGRHGAARGAAKRARCREDSLELGALRSNRRWDKGSQGLAGGVNKKNP